MNKALILTIAGTMVMTAGVLASTDGGSVEALACVGIVVALYAFIRWLFRDDMQSPSRRTLWIAGVGAICITNGYMPPINTWRLDTIVICFGTTAAVIGIRLCARNWMRERRSERREGR